LIQVNKFHFLDWTPKLNQATTPSGSIYTNTADQKSYPKKEDPNRRARAGGRYPEDEVLKPSNQISGQGASGVHQGGFGSTQVINSNAGEIIEDIGQQQQQGDDEDQGEVKCCCFRKRRRKVNLNKKN
jgi:hypothetical protein